MIPYQDFLSFLIKNDKHHFKKNAKVQKRSSPLFFFIVGPTKLNNQWKEQIFDENLRNSGPFCSSCFSKVIKISQDWKENNAQRWNLPNIFEKSHRLIQFLKHLSGNTSWVKCLSKAVPVFLTIKENFNGLHSRLKVQIQEKLESFF